MVTFKLYLCPERTPVEFFSGWKTILMHAFNDTRGKWIRFNLQSRQTMGDI